MGAGVPVAVISHALWQRRFGADSTVLGRTLTRRAPPALYDRRHYSSRLCRSRSRCHRCLASLGTFPSPNIGKRPWFDSWRSGNALRVLARVFTGTSDAWLSNVATTVYRRPPRSCRLGRWAAGRAPARATAAAQTMPRSHRPLVRHRRQGPARCYRSRANPLRSTRADGQTNRWPRPRELGTGIGYRG